MLKSWLENVLGSVSLLVLPFDYVTTGVFTTFIQDPLTAFNTLAAKLNFKTWYCQIEVHRLCEWIWSQQKVNYDVSL